MAVYCLPPISSGGNGLGSPAQSGAWTEISERGGLGGLANALDVNKEDSDLDAIKSVPHMWGRVKLFESAFSNPDHPAHKNAVEAWQGMLVMLALRKEERFGVEVVSVKFDTETCDDPSGRFARLAEREKPRRVIDESLDWRKAHLLYAVPKDKHRILIGMLSPATLVLPARSYAESESKKLEQPWLRGSIHDPLSQDDENPLTADQLAVCITYLGNIKESVKSAKGDAENLRNKLIEELESFIERLENAEVKKRVAEPREAGSRLFPGVPDKSVYEALAKDWGRGEPEHLITDCLVEPPEGAILGSVFPGGAVLADPALARILDQKPHQISVAGSEMLSNVDNDNISALQREADRFECLVLRPKDIFSDALAPLEGLEAAAHPPCLESYLAPFKPAALLLAPTLRDLLDLVRVHKDEEGRRMTVEIKVQVRPRNEGSKSHWVSREYVAPDLEPQTHDAGILLQSADGRRMAQAPNVFAAWPNFKMPDWRWNFLFSCSQDAILTSGISSEILETDLEKYDTPEDRRKRLRAWASPQGPWPRQEARQVCKPRQMGPRDHWFQTLDLEFPAGGEQKVEPHKTLQRSDFSFEGGLFFVRQPDKVNKGFDKEPIFVGIGMLPEAKKIVTIERKEARVAIDLGTTNTTVYLCIGEDDPRSISFKNILREFNNQKENKSDDRYYAEFMPKYEIASPFPTVAQNRKLIWPGSDNDNDDKMFNEAGDPILWRDHAFFDNDVSCMTNTFFDDKTGSLVFDLKWDAKSDGRKLVGRYLGHIAVLSMAQIAEEEGIKPSNVKWWFSYPMSLNDDGKEFKERVKRTVPKLLSRDSQQPECSVRFCTESEAALSYFEKSDSKKVGTLISLDIGGGTTDIAIALNRKLLWCGSVLLAGNNLMIDYLLTERAFTLKLVEHLSTVFFDEDDKKAFLEYNKEQDIPSGENRDVKIAKSVANSKIFGKVLEEELPDETGSDEYKKLESGAFLMICGILYFIGLQLKTLISENTVPENKKDYLKDIRICFAGRGSKFYKYLYVHREEFFKDALKMLEAGMGSDGVKLEAVFSDKPKHEVAAGMLLEDDRKEGDREVISELERVSGVGLDISSSDETVQHLASGDPLSRLLDLEVEVEKVDEVKIVGDDFERFLDLLKQTTGLWIDVSDLSLNLERVVSETLKKGSLDPEKPGGLGSIDPPFIAMLKETMKRLYTGDAEAGLSRRRSRRR